ncbi:MAG TPA: S41 family peptidase, partial [Candidatus Deferrimicrobium sp.]|nr:S41 family peptidase [Candidatus Deferrimicrobium sp.]
IIGYTTYGKGLVQQIFPLSADGELALKLTTAKYYVPSGRCIQKPEKQDKRKLPDPHDETADEGTEVDTLTVAEEKEIFYTNGGRVVYGGGGIVPDIEIERESWQPIEINLYRESMFFDFAVKYLAEHPDTRPDFEVSDEVVAQFRQFVKDKKFDYKSSLQVALEDLGKTISSEGEDSLFSGVLDSLNALANVEKAQDFDRSVEYIRKSIKREMVAAVAGQRGVYDEVVLKTDPAVTKAIQILTTPQEYSKLISKGQGQKKAALE